MDVSPPLPPPLRALPSARSRSLMLKLAVVGGLIVLLQVPLLLIRETLGEREQRRDEAIAEIAANWGAPQVITGPILVVPFTITNRVQREVLATAGDRVVRTEEQREVGGTAYFLPDRLSIDGEIEPSERYRGIFRAPVYAARVRLSGAFRPATDACGLERPTFHWERAKIQIGLTDARGLRAAPVWRGGEVEQVCAAAAPREAWPHLIEAPWAITSVAEAGGEFSIELGLQGTQRLAFTPVGAANRATVRGAWADPSFDGVTLPAVRTVEPAGFSAEWETAYFGRSFPQQWAEHPGRSGITGRTLEQAAFGVTLAMPVHAYRLVERALKYALLFLVLVFAVFFLFEMTATVRVHPLQYSMVGGALTLFYLGFLALGEFIAAPFAYAIAAGASTVLVTAYSGAVLCAGVRALAVGAGLTATYACLYFILQLQDYALLGGTAALFALLAAAMWATRRLERSDPPRASAGAAG